MSVDVDKIIAQSLGVADVKAPESSDNLPPPDNGFVVPESSDIASTDNAGHDGPTSTEESASDLGTVDESVKSDESFQLKSEDKDEVEKGVTVEVINQLVDRPVQSAIIESVEVRSAKLLQIETLFKSCGMDSMQQARTMTSLKEILGW